MNYTFDKKAFRPYFTIRVILLLVFICLIVSIKTLIRWHFELFDLIFYSALYLLSIILDYYFIKKLSKHSKLFLPCDYTGIPSLHLQKKHLIIYDVDYRLNSLCSVKCKWWGIIVRGKISADYSCEKELFKSKVKKRLVIPPYFSNMKGIAQRLKQAKADD